MSRDAFECHLCRRTITTGYELLGGTICNPCYSRIRWSATACPRCHHVKVLAFYDAEGLIVCAGCAGEPACFACKSCGSEEQLTGSQCGRCRLKDRAASLLSQKDGTIHPGLAGLYHHFLAAPDPRTVTRWMKHPPIEETLHAMAQGHLPINHQSLDTLPQTHRVSYFRQVLVSAGTLPPIDIHLHAYEVYSAQFIRSAPPRQASILSQYQRWYVLRVMRRASTKAPTTANTLNIRREELRKIAAFLTWIDNHDQSLETVDQAHIDQYFAAATGNTRDLNTFIKWACQQHLATGISLTRRRSTTGIAASHEELWNKVELLLNDGSIARDVRITGLFLLLFGQQVINTVRLKRSDIEVTGSKASIRFGSDAINLPPSLASLVAEQLQTPTSHYIYHQPETDWLFYGLVPTQHVTPSHMIRGLSEVGISVRPYRRAAMLQLAAALPVSVVAGTLGLSIDTAAQWAQRSGHTWGDYPALR